MRNKLFFIFLRLFFITCVLQKSGLAQMDPHFSQTYHQPMAMNPALTGAIEGDYRVSAIFRSQYGNTLQTKGISGELPTSHNANFGVNLLNQGSSDGAYSYTAAYATMAYTGVRFGPNADHYLVMALQAGVLNRRFDVSKLQFGDQWVSGVGYDGSTSSGEVFSNTSVLSFDAGVGVAYFDAVPDKVCSWFGGVAASHINSPASPFLYGGGGEHLPIKYSANGGVRVRVSDGVNWVPSVLYMREGSFTEKMIGSYLQLYAGESTDVMLGANWRTGDAVIPFAGFYYKGLTLGVSYDVTVSSLSTAATRTNSVEVSLSFIGFLKNSLGVKPFYCPRF